MVRLKKLSSKNSLEPHHACQTVISGTFVTCWSAVLGQISHLEREQLGPRCLAREGMVGPRGRCPGARRRTTVRSLMTLLSCVSLHVKCLRRPKARIHSPHNPCNGKLLWFGGLF